MSQTISAYIRKYRGKNMKYDAIAVLKLAGNVALPPSETACQNHPI